MRYPMPNYPCEFEIPDAWISEAGMEGFIRASPAYRSTPTAVAVPLREIEPPYRTPWTPKDGRGFERTRLVSVLSAIAEGVEMKPVPLLKLPAGEPYVYRVRDGYHRFFASIAAGFECLSAVIS
jgi:hypothetical protein